jgi:hypothetical protein
MGVMKRFYRWLFWRCMDCGVKLKSPKYNRGDVCTKCFDAFDGMPVDQLVNEIQSELRNK